MDEMIERVARAIMGDLGDRSGVLDGIDDETLEEMGASIARAAIKEMRKPTEAMVAAAVKAVEDDLGIRWGIGEPECKTIWQAMIDAALTPPEKD